MKLILHIVGKDLQRLRWWLFAWIGVLAAPVLTGFSALAHAPSFFGEWDVPKAHMALLGLEGLVAYVLTIVLIHEDALVGPQPFWLTRPIGRGRLFAAKAIGAAVILGLLPILVSLPWWLWCGFGIGEIAVAALESCELAALIALPAALIAVLTDSLAQAMLWTTVLLAAVPVAIFYFVAAVTAVVADQPSAALWISRSVLAVGLVAAEFAVIVGVQFFVRWRTRWLVAAAAMIVGTLCAATRWPWVFIGRLGPSEIDAVRASSVQVELRRAWAERVSAGGVNTAAGIDRMQRVGTGFFASGVPPGLMLGGMGAEQRWRFGEAFSAKWSGYLSGSNAVRIAGMRESRWGFISEDEETRRWMAEWRERKKLPLRLSTPAIPEDQAELGSSAFFRPSLVARMRADAPAYEARLWLELVRPELAFEMPLAPGRWRTHGGFGMRIESVDFTRGPRVNMKPGGGALVVLVETRPAPIGQMLRAAAEASAWFTSWWRYDREGYVVLNRERGEFVSVRGENESRSPQQLVVNGVRVLWCAKGVDAPHVIRGGTWVPVAGWMSGVTLGRITVRQEAVFAREVKADRFELRPEEKP